MSLIIICIFAGCGEQKIEIPFSAEETYEKSYENVENGLRSLGFENIEFISLMDLESKDNEDLNGIVSDIEIDGINDFVIGDKFEKNSSIVVKYHSFYENDVPINSEDAKGMSLEEVNQLLEKEKFYNIEIKITNDTDKDNVLEKEVEYIEIAGDSNFSVDKKYPINSDIVIYYSYIEDNMPITSLEAEGKSIEEVLGLFNQTQFKNVKSEFLGSGELDESLELQTKGIAINGYEGYDLKESFPINSEITIYYSYMEQNLPITSSDAKGKSQEEVLELFKQTKFKNIEVILEEDIDKDNKLEYEVERITVNGYSNYKYEEEYPINSTIVVYYSQKKYDVSIKLECEENFLFNTYDINVYVGDEYIGLLSHGTTEVFKVRLAEGAYDLTLKADGYSDVIGQKTFNIKNDRTLRYKVECNTDDIKMKYMKQLKIPYTNSEALGANVKDVEEAFKNAGYKIITKKGLNNLSANELEKSNTVSNIIIDNKTDFTSKSIYYTDSEVIIEYNCGQKIETPISSSKAKNKNYEQVVQTFKDAGFTNVQSTVYIGEYKDKARDKNVNSVVIESDDYFSEGKEVSLDAEIIVYYYSINYEYVTVATLVNELENNAYNANEYYTDRYVEITGRIGYIDSEGEDFKLYPSDNQWEIYGVLCDVTDDSQKVYIANMTKDQVITVKGRITEVGDYLGYALDIHDIVL